MQTLLFGKKAPFRVSYDRHKDGANRTWALELRDGLQTGKKGLSRVDIQRYVALTTLVAVLCLGGWPPAAQAQGSYIAGRAGINLLNDADLERGMEIGFNMGATVGGALGYRLSHALRIEGEISWRRNALDQLKGRRVAVEFDKGNLAALNFLANLFYDFDNASALTPYVGAGVGLSRITLNDPRIGNVLFEEEEDVVFASQIGVGANFELTERVGLTLGYRFFQTSDPEFEGTAIEYQSHGLMAGLQYNL